MQPFAGLEPPFTVRPAHHQRAAGFEVHLDARSLAVVERDQPFPAFVVLPDPFESDRLDPGLEQVLLDVRMHDPAAVLGLGIAVNEEAIEAFFTNPPSDWLHRLTPWIAAAAAGASLLSAAMFAIVLAPFAEVYRELTLVPEPAPEVA